MIKIISNNFGAECLDFRSFEKEGLMVANGRFYFDPSNAAYRAADVLEIKVSDMMLSKSANAAVYLVDRDNEMPHATLLKAWVKDCNTICMEPCRCFDDRPELDIIFCSGFVAKGSRDDIVIDEATQISVEATAGTFKLDYPSLYCKLCIKDEAWGFMSMLFDTFQAPEIGQEFSFIIPELPDNMDCWGVFVIAENYQDIGSPVCICQITGKVAHFTPIHKYYNYANGNRFMTMWFVLNND